MLVFNEGVPRSGKSYDAVASHILPAIKARRKVFARLNGLNHEKIAAHLSMDELEVRELLVCVAPGDVVKTFSAIPPVAGVEGSVWTIPSELQNALFVIDEVHEFYVAGRAPLPDAVEQFFALHGQNGMDGVIMTQAYKRLHQVIRARIERKNQFQKLTAVGLKGFCRVRYFVTIAPDKYERSGGRVFRYDAKIYPLYLGYAPGATNVEVYDSGSKSVWTRLLVPGALVGILALIFMPKFFGFFTSSGPKHAPAVYTAPVSPAHSATASPVPKRPEYAAEVKTAADQAREHQKYDTSGMPPEVAYVFDMSAQARPRIAAMLTWDETKRVDGIVEWREDQGHVLESLTFEQLRELGVTVEPKSYGVRIVWKTAVIVATTWPVDMPGSLNQYDNPAGVPVRSGAALPVTVVRPPSAPSTPGIDASEGHWVQRPTAASYVPPELTKVGAISSD
ncbi:zonular occludens toxin domain-containing protein [Luteibacter sp. PPL552]